MHRILPVLICIVSVGCAATTDNKATTETTSETTQVSQVSETEDKSATTSTKETVIAQGLNCDDSANLNQQQMNQCAQISYQEYDKKLNQAYQQLLPKLPESRREKLKKAQQLWIPYRDAKCDFDRSAVEGGSMAPTIYYGCLGDTTAARTKQLNGYLTELTN
ncbi:MAG: lysozyme inhibitor LprI family protein [Cyanobacteria bacterium P01_D01_bin.50]